MAGDQQTDCIFCRIARGEVGADIVAENEHAVAFRDLSPQAPTHVLVVPKRHFAALRDAVATEPSLIATLVSLAARVAEQEGLYESGYRVLTNDGPDAGQTVHHLHFHVLGGRPLREGLA